MATRIRLSASCRAMQKHLRNRRCVAASFRHRFISSSSLNCRSQQSQSSETDQTNQTDSTCSPNPTVPEPSRTQGKSPPPEWFERETDDGKIVYATQHYRKKWLQYYGSHNPVGTQFRNIDDLPIGDYINPQDRQKTILVLTGVFLTRDQIPEKIPRQLYVKARDRFRVMISISFMVFLATTMYTIRAVSMHRRNV